ncbi:alpha/beta hydrolase [Roseimaritima ulvae]|uniref:Carboxylesterase NlhH n=1 Tax=Roseimaritima ulvae TaxID=980254 RepID=A0A5B9QSL3_9BACT|nr:alpha/beta hydrolase [Roseimaritima ulvae]QEG40882.1 Carboxylesterase NlhH [Roseimaritima ulvae]
MSYTPKPWIVVCCLLLPLTANAQQRSDREAVREAKLKAALERFPQADADKDGSLTLEEFREFQKHRRESTVGRQRATKAQRVAPTHADIAYGNHPKQRFDLWLAADATEPTPLVIYIHGGGFRGGDKSSANPGHVQAFLDAGVSFAAMNYRLSDSGPYPIMMHDAARGLQTLRHRAEEWNIDPQRIACFGGSAGAGISLWLAFHDDLADPDSSDPIARQSTRILAAATAGGQSTYDMHTYREWFDVPDLPMHTALPAFYGIESEEDLNKPEVKALMKDASPISHLSKDDHVSVYMTYGRPNEEVTKETSQSNWVHHVLLGLKLKEAMEPLGLECHVAAPRLQGHSNYPAMEPFLIEKLTGQR